MAANNTYTMCTHGHSMQIEDNHALAASWRSGFCMYIEGKSGTTNWLHFAIPTPVTVAGQRLRVDSVMLVVRTMSADAVIRDIHIYDGDVKIAEHNDVNLSGDIGMIRFDVPTHPDVQLAIGLSIGVGFGIEALSHGMSFVAAGCDFVA